jgi:hypothetical protein
MLTQLLEFAERGVSEAVIQQRSQLMFDGPAGVGLPHREQVSDRRQRQSKPFSGLDEHQIEIDDSSWAGGIASLRNDQTNTFVGMNLGLPP